MAIISRYVEKKEIKPSDRTAYREQINDYMIGCAGSRISRAQIPLKGGEAIIYKSPINIGPSSGFGAEAYVSIGKNSIENIFNIMGNFIYCDRSYCTNHMSLNFESDVEDVEMCGKKYEINKKIPFKIKITPGRDRNLKLLQPINMGVVLDHPSFNYIGNFLYHEMDNNRIINSLACAEAAKKGLGLEYKTISDNEHESFFNVCSLNKDYPLKEASRISAKHAKKKAFTSAEFETTIPMKSNLPVIEKLPPAFHHHLRAEIVRMDDNYRLHMETFSDEHDMRELFSSIIAEADPIDADNSDIILMKYERPALSVAASKAGQCAVDLISLGFDATEKYVSTPIFNYMDNSPFFKQLFEYKEPIRHPIRAYKEIRRREDRDMTDYFKGFGIRPNESRSDSCLIQANPECILKNVRVKKGKR